MDKILDELDVGLQSLTLDDNFAGFEVTVDIAAGAEAKIPNQLRKRVPTRRIILRSNSASIVDGDTAWDEQFVYMKNTGASSATVTIHFLA